MNLITQLKRQEGFRPTAYQDTEGVWTIGYGHTGPEVRPGAVITREFAEQLLREDVANAEREFSEQFPYMDKNLGEPRRDAFINMVFNVGMTRFLGFTKMLTAAQRNDPGMVAIEMLDSKWHRQVKSRAVELAKQYYTGEWQEA